MKCIHTSFILCVFFLVGCENFNGSDTHEDPNSNDDHCKSKISNSFLSDNFDESSKIVFSMPDTVSGESQIFVMNNDGSGLQQLTCSEQNEASNPSFSPDASEIVFTTTQQSTTLGPSIFIMNSDGSDTRPMKLWSDSETAYPGRNPKWSPDGTKIAFDWCINCEQGGENTEIFVYDFETDSVIQITTHPSSDAYPAWSHDSERLVFTSSRDYYNADTLQFRADLYTIELSKSAPTRLTYVGYAGFPIWFPDEEQVTYSRTGTNRGLYNIGLSSKTITKINEQFSEESLLFAEAYSISGDKLLVKVRNYPFDELYIMDTNTGQTEKITSRPRELIEADWSYEK